MKAARAKTPAMLFGVATADHQCEAYDPRFVDIRDLWEVRRAQSLRGRATDFWNRYKEDIALAKSVGCTAFRFSVAWSRVEPQPGVFNEDALAHYAQMVDDLRAAGMEPIVTLHHNTHPVHVEQRGGLIGDDFPALFAAYARKVTQRFGERVTYWVTINEPTQLVYGYLKPWWAPAYFMPPGLPRGATTAEQMSAVAKLIPNLFLAHTAAREAIKAVNPRASVGSNPLLLGLPVWLQNIVDARASRLETLDDLIASAQSFTERALLEHGEVDVVIASMSITPDRQKSLAFSEVYFTTDLCLAVRADQAVHSVADLTGKVVGVVKGSTSQTVIPRVLIVADSAEYDTYADAFAALDLKSIDAVLGDRVILESCFERAPGRYRFTHDALGVETYAAALPLGSRDLLDIVDDAVRTFKESGRWKASYAEHFSADEVPEAPALGRRETIADVSTNPQAARGAREGPAKRSVLAKIRKRGYLTVGVKDDVRGLSLMDAKGAYSGLEIDLARVLATEIFGDPSRIRFQCMQTGGRTSALRSLTRLFAPLLKVIGMLSTIVASNWWHLGMAGRLPAFLCPKACVGQQDFVGFDYYWGIPALGLSALERLLDAAVGRYTSAPVWAAVLYDFLKLHADWFPGKEIFVIENGCVDAADGVTRDDYIRRHVRQVRRAVDAGVPVRAYICWSITSNREWGLKFDENSDFGLFHIDLDNDPTLTRHPTAASASYRELIAQSARW